MDWVELGYLWKQNIMYGMDGLRWPCWIYGLVNGHSVVVTQRPGPNYVVTTAVLTWYKGSICHTLQSSFVFGLSNCFGSCGFSGSPLMWDFILKFSSHSLRLCCFGLSYDPCLDLRQEEFLYAEISVNFCGYVGYTMNVLLRFEIGGNEVFASLYSFWFIGKFDLPLHQMEAVLVIIVET